MMMVSAAYLAVSGNSGDAVKNADAAYKMLDSVSTAGPVKFSDQEAKALSSSFVLFTDYLIEMKGEKQKENKEKAMKFIALAEKVLPGDVPVKDQNAKINQ